MRYKEITALICIFATLITITSVAYIIYEFNADNNGERISFGITMPKENYSLTDATDSLEMFMPNMRFMSSNISYSFSDDCKIEKIDSTKNALEIISNETGVLYFYEASDGLIKIYCDEDVKETENNTFIAGEGGPGKVINSSLYPVILNGRVYLYGSKRQEKCVYPVVEIHELMHVFGFAHIKNESSVLFPYLDCKQRMSQDIIDKLRELYSIDAKSELQVKKATASKSGIYLDFNMDVENIGLIPAENVSIEVKTIDNKYKKEFNLSDIDVGVTQSFSIKNLKLDSRNVDEITFVVKTNTPEFYPDNNMFSAKL